MHGILMVLDTIKIESKTWLYNLYFKGHWLQDTHMEVGMHYLAVKRVHYKLKQQYSTTGPFFITMLRTLHEDIGKNKETVQSAAENDIIFHDILGTTSKCSLRWTDVEFVYIPLNVGQHWVLLVLDINKRKVRVYNSSSKRGDSLKEIRQFIPCIKFLLPKLMDCFKVYEIKGEEPMGERPLEI
ncbi:unnamed protein product, partial [Cuscuta europaea]